MSKQLFIGIDGGASVCRARIRDMQGNLLGEGWGGPANICSDLALAVQSIRAASEAAGRSAGLDEQSLHGAHVGLGLAGAGIKSACDGLRSKLSPFASVVLETDAYIAWLGAHQAADGGIVILGTGSCGLAVINGRRITVGGYGAEVSDEAGGQRMGREALRRALWAFDGRADRTELSTAILERFDWDPAKIVCFASTATPADYAELAPLVLEYASARRSVGHCYRSRSSRRRHTHHRAAQGCGLSCYQSDRRPRGALDEMASFPRSSPFVRAAKRSFRRRDPHGTSCLL